MFLNKQRTNALIRLCEASGVKSLYAFGSVTRADFSEHSDIDLVVDFNENDPYKYADLYFALKDDLEQLFNREIDLIEERGIKNKFFRKELERTKVPIYGS
ncbi:nucleotidyltransferase family protein [Tunicatimonas pelagia]|uniref:nucleotidyltransferase family protein n=1 Tax=Tunicatimonas pelagia TaxID=931531 RepID=UPI002665D298|nr:nucleotidyltransferase domain-containing protein [Tunicatimonas pelagia]WKN41838.1 nucleotidyltransferase domain-containing protein [Tunicatimonas pelagia]